MLAAMFGEGGVPAQQDDTGAFFIDRDGTHFRHILNYCRCTGRHRPSLITVRVLAHRHQPAGMGPYRLACPGSLIAPSLPARRRLRPSSRLSRLELAREARFYGLLALEQW